MNFAEGDVLYVRIDYKTGSEQETEQDGMDSMEYLQRLAGERFLAAGVFGNMETEEIDGAMVLFSAKSLEEAIRIANEDPIIQRGFYRCEVRPWNLMLLSKQDS